MALLILVLGGGGLWLKSLRTVLPSEPTSAQLDMQASQDQSTGVLAQPQTEKERKPTSKGEEGTKARQAQVDKSSPAALPPTQARSTPATAGRLDVQGVGQKSSTPTPGATAAQHVPVRPKTPIPGADPGVVTEKGPSSDTVTDVAGKANQGKTAQHRGAESSSVIPDAGKEPGSNTQGAVVGADAVSAFYRAAEQLYIQVTTKAGDNEVVVSCEVLSKAYQAIGVSGSDGIWGVAMGSAKVLYERCQKYLQVLSEPVGKTEDSTVRRARLRMHEVQLMQNIVSFAYDYKQAAQSSGVSMIIAFEDLVAKVQAEPERRAKIEQAERQRAASRELQPAQSKPGASPPARRKSVKCPNCRGTGVIGFLEARSCEMCRGTGVIYR